MAKRDGETWKEPLTETTINYYSNLVTSLPTGKNFIPFTNSYRIHVHWFIYATHQILLFLLSLPLLFAPAYGWGPIFNVVFGWFYIIRTLGLEFGEYTTHWYITGSMAVLYTLLWIIFAISYIMHYNGKVTWFRVSRYIVIWSSVFLSLLYAFITYSYTTFWNCNTTSGYLNKYSSVPCYRIPNVIWGVVSGYLFISQLIFVTLSTIFITDTSCGPRASILAIDRFYCPVSEFLFQVILTMIYSLVQFYSIAVWVVPVLQILYGIGSLFVLLYFLPYFNKHVNCVMVGITLGRVCTSVVSLITAAASFDDTLIGGSTLSAAAIAVFLIGVLVGIVSTELYIFWIMQLVKKTEMTLVTSRSPGDMTTLTRRHISMKKLEIGFKFALGSRDLANIQRMDKVLKLASLQGIESCQLLISRAIMHIYFDDGTHRYATVCLANSLSYRPNFFQRFEIMLRTQDLENELGRLKDYSRVDHRVMLGYKRLAQIRRCAKKFWKLVLAQGATSADYSALARVSEYMHSAMRDCDRIVKELLHECPKYSAVVHLYSRYVDEVKRDALLARELEREANTLEQHDLNRQERRDLTLTRTGLQIGYDLFAKNSIVPIEEEQSFIEEDEEQKKQVLNTTVNDSQLDIVDLKEKTMIPPTTVQLVIDEKTESERESDRFRAEITKKDHKLKYRCIMGWLLVTLVIFLIASVIGMQVGVVVQDIEGEFQACKFQNTGYQLLDILRYGQFRTRLASNGTEFVYLNRINDILVDTTSNSGDMQWYSSVISDKYAFEIPIIGGGTNGSYSSYVVNRTLYDFAVLMENTMSSMLLQTRFNDTTQSQNFMTMWSNRLRILDNYSKYCTAFLNANMVSINLGNSGLIVIYIIAGLLHAAFLIAYIPSLVLLIISRWRIFRVFDLIPKSNVSEIYTQLKQVIGRGGKDKLPKVLSHHKLVACSIVTLIIELIILACIISDNNYKISLYSGTYQLVQNAAVLNTRLRKIHFEVGELTLQNPTDGLSSSDLNAANILSQIELARTLWSQVRFGSTSSKGLLGTSVQTDNLIQTDNANCQSLALYINAKNRTITRESLVDDYVCNSMNTMVEKILSSSADQIKRYPFMTMIDRFKAHNATFFLVDSIRNRLEYVTSQFFTPMDYPTGFNFWYIYVILLILLVLVIIPIFTNTHTFIAVNHQIRKMLIFLPDELVENSEVLQAYVHNFKTQFTFQTIQEQQTYALAEVETNEEPKSPTSLLASTKSILDAVNEPMLLVDENMKIVKVNSCCLELLGYTGTELENKQFGTIFQTDEQIDLKNTKHVSLQAIKKNEDTLHMTASISNDSKISTIILHDATQEDLYKSQIQVERQTNEKLLSTMFPYPIMDRIIQGETNIAEAFPDVTCCKIELVGFQGMSEEMSALDIVQLLNACVNEFDDLAEEHSLVKIKSSGTDYLCIGGLHSHERDHAQHVIQFAIEALHAITEVSQQLSLRIGIHSGAVTAGVIGKHRQSYDVWGETVDFTNRMCVMAPTGRIQCSHETYARTHDVYQFEETEHQGYLVMLEHDENREQSIASPLSTSSPTIEEQDSVSIRPITQPPSPTSSSFLRATSPLPRPITPNKNMVTPEVMMKQPIRRALPPIEKTKK